MKTTSVTRSVLSLAIAAAVSYGGAAQAGGFQISETCGKCQGVRNAGLAAASVDSPATLFFNPASLSRLQNGNFDANLHFLYPRFQFRDRGSTNAFGQSPAPLSRLAAPATGDRKDDAGENAWIPTIFYGQQIDDHWSAGLGFSMPYGLETNYSNNWVGRYNAIESRVLTYNINPAVAFRFNEQLSIGAGFNVLYADARLTNAIDYGSLSYLATRGGFGAPSSRQFDGLQKLTGDDWGYGWNAGVLYEPQPGLRFGAAYRSKVDVELEGDVRIRGNPSFAQAPGPLQAFSVSQKLPISANLNLPATFALGGYYDVTDRLAIMAGTIWTDWSQFQELRVNFENSDRPDSVQPENWTDTWRTALGVAYKLDNGWMLRSGFEYDPTPVKTKYRTPRVPDEDRYWLAVGADYNPTPELSLAFAYNYLFTPNYNIDDTEVTTGNSSGQPIGNTVKGRYSADAHIVTAQAIWRF